MINRGTNRGRGGGSYSNMGGRGGNQTGGSFRGQSSNRGFQQNRRGGSFNSQGYGQQHSQYQQNNYHNHQNQGYQSYRGRGGQNYQHSTRGNRHDSSSTTNGRDNLSTASGSFSSGSKRDQNKRTLTDFKIVGLKILKLNWTWGSSPETADSTVKDEDKPTVVLPDLSAATLPADGNTPANAEGTSTCVDVVAGTVSTLPDASAVKAELEALIPPPPSRVRMYFHTPVTPDDAHPISQASYAAAAAMPGARKGKRKKLEDDDGDYEEGRGAPPPPPGMDADYDGTGRDSVAPSVAETQSDGDWLMAAISEEDGNGGENLHASEVEHFLDRGGDGGWGQAIKRIGSCAGSVVDRRVYIDKW